MRRGADEEKLWCAKRKTEKWRRWLGQRGTECRGVREKRRRKNRRRKEGRKEERLKRGRKGER